LVGKSVVEDENKNLKNEVNRLTQELCSREQDIEGLKSEIDKQRLVKDELLRQMDSQQSEISKLHAKIKLLGGGEEVSSVFDELENKNQEVEKLKVTVADLERHVEDLRKQRPEVGKGDMEERRSRKLEATLQKYHDNNESLKMQIVRLETEKTNLKVELNARLGTNRAAPFCSVSFWCFQRRKRSRREVRRKSDTCVNWKKACSAIRTTTRV
jgi:serine/threonine-protein kinase 24/25/MST4